MLFMSMMHLLPQADFIPGAGRTTKASLCLLKICNALLRRLSKTHNSVFCGKILVFLSSTFALSERSAVNLSGMVREPAATHTRDLADGLTQCVYVRACVINAAEPGECDGVRRPRGVRQRGGDGLGAHGLESYRGE